MADFPRKLLVPDHELIPEATSRLYSEAEYYGASQIVSSIVSRGMSPVSCRSWLHGWAGIAPIKYPSQLAEKNRHPSNRFNHLVHTQKQQDFLVSHGYKNVIAVGMPFAYAWRFFEGPARSPGSILVMPPHMTKYVDIDYNESDYVEFVTSFSSDFDSVAACITSACDEHGRWRASFERAGVKVIRGANVYDRNALLRMLSLFSEFDYVTSPELGSHVVYAALSGCKVSICGQCGCPERKDFEKEPYFAKNPEILNLQFSDEVLAHRSRIKAQFSSSPIGAYQKIEWAKEQAGIRDLINPYDLAVLLRLGHPSTYLLRLKSSASNWLSLAKATCKRPFKGGGQRG